MVGFERVDGTLQDFTDIEDEVLWEIAGRQGLRTCAVGVRTTYPPRPVENGVVVSGDLYTPPDATDYMFPEHLPDDVPGVESFHDGLAELDELQKNADIPCFIEAASTTTRTQHGVFEDIIAETDPDLAMFWIGAADKLQHLAWDEKDVLAEYYELIDGLLKQTLDRFEPEVTYVISDHGFEAVYERELHLNTWLERRGYLRTTPAAPMSRYIGPLVSKYVPNGLTDKAQSVLSKMGGAATSGDEAASHSAGSTRRNVTVPGVDYERSTAVMVNEWGINVLASNRRSEIVDSLVSDLRALHIQGEPVFRFVARREDVYTGRYLDRFPDVIVLPTREYHLNHTLSRSLTSPTGGSSHRSGYHIYNPDGVFAASGAEIPTAAGLTIAAEEFAPTVLHELGVGVPADIDASPMTEALSTHRRTDDVTTIRPRAPTLVDPEQKSTTNEDVEDRLRDMGYL